MSITLILGCMYSGKTTELIRQMRRARIAGLTTQLYKYARDVRYDNLKLASSHDGVKEVAIPIVNADEIGPWQSGMIIGIDEGQFILNLSAVAEKMANEGVHVIISALDTDYHRQPFPMMERLWFLCEKRLQMHAICVVCKGEASFTQRIVESDELELIGGTEAYRAVCRRCYFTCDSTLMLV